MDYKDVQSKTQTYLSQKLGGMQIVNRSKHLAVRGRGKLMICIVVHDIENTCCNL